MIRSACQKKCAQVCGETQQKTKSSSGRRRPPRQWEQNIKKNNGFSIFFMKSLVIPYQSKIRDDKYTLPVKRKELSCADFGIRFWQSPVNALRRKNVLWHRPAGKRFWLLRARPANLRKFVRLQFHRGANGTKHVQFKCRLPHCKMLWTL